MKVSASIGRRPTFQSNGGTGMKMLGDLHQNSTLISRPKGPAMTGDRSFRMAGPLHSNSTLTGGRKGRSMSGGSRRLVRRGLD